MNENIVSSKEDKMNIKSINQLNGIRLQFSVPKESKWRAEEKKTDEYASNSKPIHQMWTQESMSECKSIQGLYKYTYMFFLLHLR